MSLDAKRRFVADVQQDLAQVLTVAQMGQVTDAITRLLTSYDVELEDRQPWEGGSELIEVFLQAKKIEGRSEKTIERYRYILNRFMEAADVPIQDVTVFTIRKYLTGELARGICENTISGYQTVFSSCFGWLWREGLIKANPCANIGAIKVPKKQRLPFTAVEIEAIKDHCGSLRDKAVVCFLLATGCRIEETTRLDRGDVDFQKLECTVFGKGQKERKVFLDDVSASVLRRYLATRTDTGRALFVGRGSERMTPGGIRRMLKRIEAESGVENIHPHRFRRTLATSMANRGMNLQEIAYILGHENVNTTMRYVCVQESNVKHHYQMMSA